MNKSARLFYRAFPPSPPCSCTVCRGFCARPGWWLVEEARSAMDDGLAGSMMLEVSPDRSFGVLSLAFKGNESFFALQEFAGNACTFFIDERCSIFGKPYQPIECRFCHHDRPGLGASCHRRIERDWNTGKGKRLVREWLETRRLPLRIGP